MNVTATGWNGAACVTDIPLESASQYFITFKATMGITYNHMGFIFSCNNDTNFDAKNLTLKHAPSNGWYDSVGGACP